MMTSLHCATCVAGRFSWVRLFLVLACLAVNLGGPTTPVIAAEGTQPEERAWSLQIDSTSTSTLIDDVEERWTQRKRLLRNLDRAGASQAEREISEFLAQGSIQRFGALADACVLEAERQEEEGPALALATYRLCRQFDPSNGAAWFGEARTTWRKGDGAAAALELVSKGLLARWSNFWGLYADGVNLLGLAFWSLLIAGGAGVIVLLLLHGPSLVHAIGGVLPKSWHPAWRSALGCTVLCLPLFGGGVGIWTLAVWAVFLIAACRRRERGLLYGLLILLALTAPFIDGLRVLTASAGSPQVRAAVATGEGSLTPGMITEMAALVDQNPDEVIWKLLLARMIAEDAPDRAVQLLREASRIDAADPRIPIMLGNLFYRLDKPEAAGIYFLQALDRDPENLIALFNLYRVRQSSLDLSEAEALIQTARSIDREQADRLWATMPRGGVADPVFPLREIASRAFSENMKAQPAIRPINAVSLTALAAIMVAAAWQIRFRRISARRCARCGSAMSRQGTGGNEEEPVCPPCTHLFARRAGLAPAVREVQARKVESHLNRRRRFGFWVHLVWPGLVQLYEGRTWTGYLMTASWAFLLLGALFPEHLLPGPTSTPTWPPGAPFVFLIAIFWFAAQSPPLRPHPVVRREGR